MTRPNFAKRKQRSKWKIPPQTFSICDFQIQKQISRGFAKSFSPEKQVTTGAEGGSRTLTELPLRDFESRASANSATSAKYLL